MYTFFMLQNFSLPNERTEMQAENPILEKLGVKIMDQPDLGIHMLATYVTLSFNFGWKSVHLVGS